MKWALILLVWPFAAYADLKSADVAFLGEVHDNPAHHAKQAALIGRIQPKSAVFEMLTAEQAAVITPALLLDPEALEDALAWQTSGWPDFEMYYPVFSALGDAHVYGAAVLREEARAAVGDMLAAFGPDAARFGLDNPLPEAQQQAREALQMAAHCDALQPEMLPVMVSIQRMRDARLAQVALQALEDTGGPVAVVTGNGHARRDWGAPALLGYADPGVQLFALGQGEGEDAPPGTFDLVRNAPPPERGDPCEAFAMPAATDTTD